jgi:TPR repeat protein
MERTALDAVRRVQSTAERAKNAAKRNPITSGTLALGAVGAGLWFASQSLLYTDDTCNKSTLDQVLDTAKHLDPKNVDTPNNQKHFEALMANWTTAAGLYSQAGNCPEAHYALGRLCYEGRGYVYDPEYGTQLYERAAFAGNEDAMYALACIALSNNKLYPHQAYLYEAASLLRRASSHPGSQRTLADVSQWTDPGEWIRATVANLKEAAKNAVAATSQIYNISQQMAHKSLFRANPPPPPFNGGFREKVTSIDGSVWNYSAHADDVLRFLTETRKKSTDPHEMELAARVGFQYTQRINAHSGINKLAGELRDEAARKGDVGAILETWKEIHEWEEKDIERLLDRGVRAGSRELLYRRGNAYKYLKKEDLAKKDYLAAADLGHQDSMIAYRRLITPRFDTIEGYHNVIVYPFPAALAMDLHPDETVVFGANSTEAATDPTAILKRLNLAPEDSGNDSFGIITSKDETGGRSWIEANWSTIGVLDKKEAALSMLYNDYHNVFAECGSTVIMQPIDKSLWGKYNKFELTASAIHAARRGNEPQVILCVFDDLSTVASYDTAFSALDDETESDTDDEIKTATIVEK